MARKPAHLAAAGPRQDRQAQWEVMRRLRSFTVPELRGELHGATPYDAIRTYCMALTAAGILKKRGSRYGLAKDTGVDAPRVRKDGTEATQGRGRDQLWRAMKILADFSANDLSIMCSEDDPVAISTAEDYCGWLHRAGYLQQTKAPSTRGGQARYRLIPNRYTGPKPPMIQRIKQVYDPNTGDVVYRQEAGR